MKFRKGEPFPVDGRLEAVPLFASSGPPLLEPPAIVPSMVTLLLLGFGMLGLGGLRLRKKV